MATGNRVAVITGAARGSGRSHAAALAAEGMDIIAVDCCADNASTPYPSVAVENLSQTADLVRAAGARVRTVVADVRDASAIREGINSAIDDLGDVNVVVASATATGEGFTEPFDDRVFGDILDVNLRGVWHTMAATIPSMIRSPRGGSVVVVNPMKTSLGRSVADGSTEAFAISVSKHGVDGLVQSAAQAYAGYGIRVNAVEPTGLARSTVPQSSSNRFVDGAIAGEVMAANLRPLPPADPVDVTEAVLFLISEEARFITGMTLPVHAGFAPK